MKRRELIVASNPARRRRRQTAKQRAASLRNLRKARRARNPRKRTRRRRRNPSTAVARRAAPVRRNPARRRNRIARRRNRVSLRTRRKLIPAGLVDRQLMPAAIGGAGAVANDILYSFLPLPPLFATGVMRHVGKAGSALLLAWAASLVTKPSTANQLGAGALTVIGYNVVRDVVAKIAPSVPMGEYLMPGLGYVGAGMNPGFGEYLDPGAMGRLPAPTGGQFSDDLGVFASGDAFDSSVL